MSLRHIVDIGGGIYREPGIFQDADEERVKEALKLAKKLESAKIFMSHEGKIKFQKPISGFLGGFLGSYILSGAIADIAGFQAGNPLWFGASESFINELLRHFPGWMLPMLSLEMGGMMAIERISNFRKQRGEAKKTLERWENSKFKNDELVHVFTRENKLDPSYREDQLYFYDGKGLPDAILKKYLSGNKILDKDGNLIDEFVNVPWTRFHPDGKFRLVFGESNERDGRFNATPEIISIPEEGLWTGVMLVGPTGSGKCLVGGTGIPDAENGGKVTIRDLYENRREFFTYSEAPDGSLVKQRVKDVVSNGLKPVFTLLTDHGHEIRATENHPFRWENGYKNLGDLRPGDRIVSVGGLGDFPQSQGCKRIEFATITGIWASGIEETFDIEMEEIHNFIANGLVVHNSQANLLPMIEQFLSYYSWVDSERDFWIYDVPKKVLDMRHQANEMGGSEGAVLLKKAEILESEQIKKINKSKNGDEIGSGREKIGMFLVEPKDEMWFDVLTQLRRLGREKDYIELGAIKSRYARYSEVTAHLLTSIRQLWSYVPDLCIERSAYEWLSHGMAKENGIKATEERAGKYVETDHYNFAPDILDRVYGRGGSRDWIYDISGAGSLSRDGNIASGGQYYSKLSRLSIELISPFCFPLNRGNSEWANEERNSEGVGKIGPFGFGTKNEPWIAETWDKNAGVNNAQDNFLDVFDGANKVYGALGCTFRFKADMLKPQGAFRLVSWKEMAVGVLQPGQGQATFVPPKECQIGDLTLARKEYPKVNQYKTNDFYIDEIANCSMLSPAVAPNALLLPSIKAQGQGGNKDAVQADHDTFRIALGLLPADRTELTRRVRKLVRFTAPLSRIPGERKADYRNRYFLWKSARKSNQYHFVECLMVGTDDSSIEDQSEKLQRLRVVDGNLFGEGGRKSNRGIQLVNDEISRRGQKRFGEQVFRLLFDKCGTGMVHGMLIHYMNNPVTMDLAVRDLIQDGYVFNGDLAKEQGLALTHFYKMQVRSDTDGEDALVDPLESEVLPFDFFVGRCLGLSDGLKAELVAVSGAKQDKDGYFQDIDNFMKFKRARESHLWAALLKSLINQASSKGVESAVMGARRDAIEAMMGFLLDFLAGIPEDGSGSISQLAGRVKGGTVSFSDAEWLMKAIFKFTNEHLKQIMVYDPRVTSGEPISTEPEDLECVVDPDPIDLPLGPWDSIWSESIWSEIREPMRVIVRNVMAIAMSNVGHAESTIVQKTYDDAERKAQIERAQANRRKDVLEKTMDYFGAIEGYLSSIAPYYKANTHFSYGYDDRVGGPCCGASKFNPLHLPDANPNQVASGLMGVLSRNAGEGDTSFWNDAGIMLSENMIGLLRAGVGYVTVPSLVQMASSDAFVDTVVAQAKTRLEEMQSAQVGNSDSPETKLIRESWQKNLGLQGNVDLESGLAVPYEARTMLPRAPSPKELLEAQEYFKNGVAFLNQEWRSPKGSFADVEIRGTVKLNLVNQLTPITQGIGAYSFSPEDPEEISFPTWWEIRTLGQCVVTRFNQTSDPKLGSVVSSMAITGYQQMVLSAKQMQTQAKEFFGPAWKRIRENRAELSTLRRNLKDLEAKEGAKKAESAIVREYVKKRMGEDEGKVDAGAFGSLVAKELVALEHEGKLEGVITPESLDDVLTMNLTGGTAKDRVKSRIALVAKKAESNNWRVDAQNALYSDLKTLLSARSEKIIELRDNIKRTRQRIWKLRQSILNDLSEIEEFPDFERIMAHIVDEYQMYKNFAKKGGGLSDDIFLSASRAGKSINIYCTQMPSSVKAGASQEQFNSWIGNLRIHIVLGTPNKEDQEMLSDLWRGEEKEVQGDTNFSVSYEGVGMDQGGAIRGGSAGSVNKTFATKKEMVKYVKPEELAMVPTMRSWFRGYDGNTTWKPMMINHIPYFLQTSDKVSSVTSEPLCMKTFVSLVRDGELNLVKYEDFNLRDMLRGLQEFGVDVQDEMEALDAKEKALRDER